MAPRPPERAVPTMATTAGCRDKVVTTHQSEPGRIGKLSHHNLAHDFRATICKRTNNLAPVIDCQTVQLAPFA